MKKILLKSFCLSSVIPWNTKELNPGIYLLQAKSAESTQTVKAVVLN